MRASSAVFGDFMSAYEDPYFQQPYEELRGVLSPAYENLPPDQLEQVLRERLGDVSPEAMEDFLGTLAQVGQAVLPVLLPAIGTVVGGPVGGVIGGVAGQAAAGAIGAATSKQAKPSGPKKAAQKTKPAARVPLPKPPVPPPPAAPPPPSPPSQVSQLLPSIPSIMHPSRPAVPVIAPPSPPNPAAAQLLSLMFRPEFVQALAAMMLGNAGRDQIPVGGKDVPVGAFANLLSVLADQISADHHATRNSFADGIPEYLVESDGELKCDLTVPEERAQVLWEMLQEDAEQTPGMPMPGMPMPGMPFGGGMFDPSLFLQPAQMAWQMMQQQQFLNPLAFPGFFESYEDYDDY